jgi:dynein heavy chain 2
MKYYVQLKRFLAIPNEFKGVSESSENLIFPSIISRNGMRFPHLFRKAEELFERLDKVKDSFLFGFTIILLFKK